MRPAGTITEEVLKPDFEPAHPQGDEANGDDSLKPANPGLGGIRRHRVSADESH